LAEKILATKVGGAAKAGEYAETVAYEWGEDEWPQQASAGFF